MASEPSSKALAWPLFDAIVDRADLRSVNPWQADGSFKPDYDTLTQLLGVSTLLGAESASGVPALALDVWVSYELRRAGLDADSVWPRAVAPRVISRDVLRFLNNFPPDVQDDLRQRLTRDLGKGVAGGSATLLGKNYTKQVDVVVSAWETGPEVLISTKRMDYSFGNNAANRVEESYGDAKNLRLRYPQAACGFVFALRSTAWDKTPRTGLTGIADRLVDLLGKLGSEPDAYHATALIVPEYDEPPTQKAANTAHKEAESARTKAEKAEKAARETATAASAAQAEASAASAAAVAEPDPKAKKVAERAAKKATTASAKAAAKAQKARSKAEEALVIADLLEKRAAEVTEAAAQAAETQTEAVRAAMAAEVAVARSTGAASGPAPSKPEIGDGPTQDPGPAGQEGDALFNVDSDETGGQVAETVTSDGPSGADSDDEGSAKADAEAAGAGAVADEAPVLLPAEHVNDQLQRLPAVRLRHDRVPPALDPARFFAVMLDTLLTNTPVDYHREARARREAASANDLASQPPRAPSVTALARRRRRQVRGARRRPPRA